MGRNEPEPPFSIYLYFPALAAKIDKVELVKREQLT